MNLIKDLGIPLIVLFLLVLVFTGISVRLTERSNAFSSWMQMPNTNPPMDIGFREDGVVVWRQRPNDGPRQYPKKP